MKVFFTPAEEHAAIKLMEQIGGGFASALAVAWIRADDGNRNRLRCAFNDLLESYVKQARTLHLC